MARPKDPEERRRIVAAAERKDKTKRTLRSLGIGAIVVVVLVAIGLVIAAVPKPPPQVHWHATYQVWVQSPQGTDELVSFAAPDGRFYFDNNRDAQYLPAHVHACNPNLIHNEAREGQGKLIDLFNSDWLSLGAHLSSTELIIPQGATFAGDYKDDGNHTVKLFVSHDNGTWEPDNIQQYSFQNRDRILLMYGNQTADDVAQKEAAFPNFEDKVVC
jgi:hypothetical protein